MPSRDNLHQLVDKLPDSEILRAERVLQVLRETADPVVYALENAPEDDESESPEEALDEHQRVLLEIRTEPEEGVSAALKAWHRVYEGLSEEEIAEVEAIALDRGHFFREGR